MMITKEVRDLTLLQLFSHTFHKEDGGDISFIEDVENAPEEVKNAVKALFFAIQEKEAEILESISKFTKNWSVNRIAKVELAALKISIYEMTYNDPVTEPAVSINAAVEMVKKYGNERGYRFVNGVLDAYRKACVGTSK